MSHAAFHLREFKREKRVPMVHDPQAYSVFAPMPGMTVRKILSDEAFDRHVRAKWQEKRLRMRNGEEIPSA